MSLVLPDDYGPSTLQKIKTTTDPLNRQYFPKVFTFVGITIMTQLKKLCKFTEFYKGLLPDKFLGFAKATLFHYLKLKESGIITFGLKVRVNYINTCCFS